MPAQPAHNPSPHWSVPLVQSLRDLLHFRRFWTLGVLLALPLAGEITRRIGDARLGKGLEPGAPIPESLVEALRSSGEFVPVLRETTVVFLCILGAILWTGPVWAGLGFGKRDYLLSLPVSRPAHELWRVAAGAIGLTLGLLVVMAVGGGFALLEGIPLFPEGSGPFWLSFFGVPLAIYAMTSIAMVSSRYPGGWTMGSFFGLVLLRVLDIPPVNQVIGIIFIGLPDTPVYRAARARAWTRARARVRGPRAAALQPQR
jgi:hypothetical protein